MRYAAQAAIAIDSVAAGALYMKAGGLFSSRSPSTVMNVKSAENGVLAKKVLVNPPAAHAELISTYRRAQAEAAHKSGLIQAAASKGPKAIQAAVETAAKAAKRRDSYAKKLAMLGVDLKD